MIQHAHLTAWQTYAPWPKRSQIEQDLRLSLGVAAIFADPLLNKHVAMRGGTVLHKAHLAPTARYSEDIDLVLVKAIDPDTLDERLRRVLTPVLGQPAGSLIMEAFAWYLEQGGTHLGASEANALLDERLRSRSFRRDMDTLLRPGLPKFDVDVAAAVVRQAYFKHLKP
jgi:nucleotidyltransferase AbiEii toxin of type IV toxin-antitoxin system